MNSFIGGFLNLIVQIMKKVHQSKEEIHNQKLNN